MAVRQINLIPANILARTAFTRHLWFWGKGLIFILLLFVILYLVQASRFALQQKALNSESSSKIQVLNKIGHAKGEADDINSQMQDLALKSGLLASLTNQQLYYDILAVFAESFNGDTWINHLTIQRGTEKDTDRSNLMVDGFSLTHNTLGIFLESLAGNKRIDDVVLVYAKKKQGQEGLDPDLSNVVQFKLTCSIIKGSSK